MLFPIDRIPAKALCIRNHILPGQQDAVCGGQAGQRSDNHAVLYDGQPHPF